MVKRLALLLALSNDMKKNFARFIISILLYMASSYSHYVLISPTYSLIDLTSVIPPLIGIIWGLPAAFGSLVGALWDEYTDWYIIPEILNEEGIEEAIWQCVLLFCNCGLWGFLIAYMPWRLSYSLFVNPDKYVLTLRVGIVLKFIWILFLTYISEALFLAMTTNESDTLRLIDGQEINFSPSAEYALTCFLNIDFAIFFGLLLFFILFTSGYHFETPKPATKTNSDLQTAFDIIYSLAIIAAIFLCQSDMIPHEGIRFFVGILIFSYMFRPLSSFKVDVDINDKVFRQEDMKLIRKIVGVFYVFFIVLFLILDMSGIIYGLTDINTWKMFNAECITMIDISLIALICMLLRYKHSIMTNVVLLEVLTVFSSAFILGSVCIGVTDKIIFQRDSDAIEEMSIICRERLERTLNNIKITVNDIGDLAINELDSYDTISNEQLREDYLKKVEKLSKTVASNTEGSIAFYFRLAPEVAGPLGGFSWSRDNNRWEGTPAEFKKRIPIDLSKYSQHDTDNVGWFYIPFERHNATWIEPYIDPTLQSYVISYVKPLYIEDKFIGVIGIDIDFDYLIHEVRRMSVYDYGFVYLIDRNDRVLYHRDYEQGDEFVPNAEFKEYETYLTNGIWIGVSVPLSYIYNERNNLLMHLISGMLMIAIIASCMSIALASRGIRPLLSLTHAAQKIAKGDLSINLPNINVTEIGTLVNSIREMVDKLDIYVYRDKITGLRNTTAYDKKKKELKAKVYPKYAVVVFDVNFLKRTNDTYGHDVGNELIKIASSNIRKIFINSSIYRIGGDEFVAVLENIDYDRRDELISLFDKLFENKSFEAKNNIIKVSVARGMSVSRQGVDYDVIFAEADKAMYKNKQEIKKKFGLDKDGR